MVFDLLRQVLAIRILHDYAEFIFFGKEDFFEFYDIGVLKNLKYFGFLERFLLFLLTHEGHVHFFDDPFGLVC